MELRVTAAMVETDRARLAAEQQRRDQAKRHEEYEMAERTKYRVIGMCVAVGIVAVTLVVVYLTARVNQTSEKRERTKMAKVEMCRSLELPADRTLCLSVIE